LYPVPFGLNGEQFFGVAEYEEISRNSLHRLPLRFNEVPFNALVR
jgi:hypothetical protein